MKFGRCKKCREYRMLYKNGKCYTHTSDIDISIGLKATDNIYTPTEMDEFSSKIASDIRMSEGNPTYDAVLVLAELEIIVEDNSGDPIQTFEYSSYSSENEVSKATEDAVEWIVNNS